MRPSVVVTERVVSPASVKYHTEKKQLGVEGKIKWNGTGSLKSGQTFSTGTADFPSQKI